MSVGIPTLNEAVLERYAYTGPERRRSPTALLRLARADKDLEVCLA